MYAGGETFGLWPYCEKDGEQRVIVVGVPFSGGGVVSLKGILLER